MRLQQVKLDTTYDHRMAESDGRTTSLTDACVESPTDKDQETNGSRENQTLRICSPKTASRKHTLMTGQQWCLILHQKTHTRGSTDAIAIHANPLRPTIELQESHYIYAGQTNRSCVPHQAHDAIIIPRLAGHDLQLRSTMTHWIRTAFESSASYLTANAATAVCRSCSSQSPRSNLERSTVHCRESRSALNNSWSVKYCTHTYSDRHPVRLTMMHFHIPSSEGSPSTHPNCHIVGGIPM